VPTPTQLLVAIAVSMAAMLLLWVVVTFAATAG
jgi:hypothetical protein